MNYLIEFKKAYLIRKIEEFFLEMFKKGKISGTVHTCVGQEFTGVFASKYSELGDYVVSNHRGHGHYISFTNDIDGLIAELLGNVNGCSKGIGGSQHLFNKYFFSNGIQGGMLPIAAGLAFSNKLEKNNNISIAFLGDGTLGEGILYETLNMVSLWDIPIIFILEKNYISQSTSFEQNFSGNIKDRVIGFGIKYFSCTIYDLPNLDNVFKESFSFSRNNSKPVFIEVEVARLNSHSKGDDNRDISHIKEIRNIDPLNLFINKNKSLVENWDLEIDGIINSILDKLNRNITESSIRQINLIPNTESYTKKNISEKNNRRFNDLIYFELEKVLKYYKNSILIGEDIENNNNFNPNEYGGAFKVTKDLSNKFPERVKNTPISEQAIVGIAIGNAMHGNVSIVEIMFGDFITLAFDQLLQHVSKFTLMYGTILEIPFILRTPMGGFRGYGPTHSQSLEKHFLGIPGLNVVALNQLVCPSEIFTVILNQRKPVLLIENKTLYTKVLYENMIEGYNLYTVNNENSYPVINLKPEEEYLNITIVCYGGIVDEVLKAVNLLFIENEILVDIFVITELTSTNIPGLFESINVTKKLCFIEEGSSFSSFSSEVISSLIENRIHDFSLLRISNNHIIPSSRELEMEVLPSSLKIKSLIKNFLK
jgi:2-oxoisovalerate dehydrogenase E1 component